MSRFMFFALVVWAALHCSARPKAAYAEIYSPGQSVPGLSSDVFHWSQGDADSTFAFWDTFATFPGGSIPGGIAPGISPESNSSYSDGGSPTTLTFNSYGTIVSSGNVYGYNFAPGQPAFQPEFVTNAFATVRSGTSGGNNTRIVAQWQTQGSELDYDSLFLSLDTGSAGTLAPSLSIETGRQSLGGFGGELVNRMAVWDLGSSQDAFRIDFGAQANHMSFDQFRVDTFTQGTSFITPVAVPEPSSLAILGLCAGGMVLRRRRRKPSIDRRRVLLRRTQS